MEVHSDRFVLTHIETPQIIPEDHIARDVVRRRACRNVAKTGVTEHVGQRQGGDVCTARILNGDLEAHCVADHGGAVGWLQKCLDQC